MVVSSSTVYLTKLRRIKSLTAFCCFMGIALSSFALYVEFQKERDESYVAMCDISQHMSCSKVFTSKYGKGFGLLQYLVNEESVLIQPNPVYGLFFYTTVLFLSYGNFLFLAKIQLILCVVGNLGSVYLGYILYFILQDLCVVCVSTYVVNFALLFSTLLRVSNLKKLNSETGGPIIYGIPSKSKKRV